MSQLVVSVLKTKAKVYLHVALPHITHLVVQFCLKKNKQQCVKGHVLMQIFDNEGLFCISWNNYFFS